MLSTITQKLKADLEIAEKATEGPWEVKTESGLVFSTQCEFHAEELIFTSTAIHNQKRKLNSAFIAHSRTALPANTRALMLALEVLTKVADPEQINNWPHPTHNKSYWKEAEKALAEIAEILGVGK